VVVLLVWLSNWCGCTTGSLWLSNWCGCLTVVRALVCDPTFKNNDVLHNLFVFLISNINRLLDKSKESIIEFVGIFWHFYSTFCLVQIFFVQPTTLCLTAILSTYLMNNIIIKFYFKVLQTFFNSLCNLNLQYWISDNCCKFIRYSFDNRLCCEDVNGILEI